MRIVFMFLMCTVFLIGNVYGETIINDQSSGVVKMYRDDNSTLIAHSVGSEDTLTSTYLLKGSSVSSVDVDLNAKITPYDNYRGITGHYRTYYRPGEKVALWAQWRPFYSWEMPFVGKELTITHTLKKGADILFESRIQQPLTDSDANWTGSAPSYEIPATAKVGDVYTLTVTFSVNGINIVNTNQSAPEKTKLYIIGESPSDLPIRFLYEFEQRDWDWGQDKLGTCNTTMAKEGCATTAKAFAFSTIEPYYISPGYMNSCLTSQGGYAGGCLIPQNNDNNISNKCAPLGVFWEGYYPKDKKTPDRINQSLKDGIPVIVKAAQYGAKHYYTIVGKRADNKWNVFDPLDGQIHMMESRGLTYSMIEAIYLYSLW